MPGTESKAIRIGRRLAALVSMILVIGLAFQPASCEYIPSDVAGRFADAAKSIIVEIINFLTPIVNVICAGMVILGIILAAGLRQEFYGIRLVIGGGIGLLVVNVVIPVLLEML